MDVQLAAWWRLADRHRAVVVVVAVLLPLAVCAACGAADVPPSSSVLLVVLCVVLAAITRVRVAAAAAALSGGVWFDFFLTVPTQSLKIAAGEDVVVTVLLVVIGAVVSELVAWALRQEETAARRAGYLDGALASAEAAAAGDVPAGELATVVASRIADVLDVPSCRYVEGRVHDARIAVLDHDGTLTRAGRTIDVDRSGLPTDEQVAIEVVRGDDVPGHFLLSSAARVSRPTLEQRRVAVLLADLVVRTTSAPPSTRQRRTRNTRSR